MANSSLLGGERAAARAKGFDVDALGPSDSSDSGSDIQGEQVMPTSPDNPDELGALPTRGDCDSDTFGTGERGCATGKARPENVDLLPDRIAQDPSFCSNDFGDHELLIDDQVRVEDLALDSDEDEEDVDPEIWPSEAHPLI